MLQTISESENQCQNQRGISITRGSVVPRLGAGVQSLVLQTLVSALRQVWEKLDPFMSGCSKLSQQPRLPKELPCGYNRLASRAFGHKLEKPLSPLSSHQGEGGRAGPLTQTLGQALSSKAQTPWHIGVTLMLRPEAASRVSPGPGKPRC